MDAQGKSKETRWHITHKESGLNRSYGFAATHTEARRRVDDFLKRSAEGRDPLPRADMWFPPPDTLDVQSNQIG